MPDDRREERHQFSLLSALEQDAGQSQRRLADTTGINLAKVNFLLKKLLRKGLIKIHNASRKPNEVRYLYLLTPDGLSEKSRLAYRFLQRTVEYWNGLEAAVRETLDEIDRLGWRRPGVYGANEIAAFVVRVIREDGRFELAGLYDPEPASGEIGGVAVRALAEAARDRCDCLIMARPELTGGAAGPAPVWIRGLDRIVANYYG